MQVSFVLLFLTMLSGCQHLALGIPIQIKAGIEGNIKGINIKCENSLELNHGQWGVMCQAGNDINVKYQVKSLPGDLSKLKFLVAKEKEGHQKIIASPALILKSGERSSSTVTTDTSNILIKAERSN